jgi:CspA family cold shock protein
MRPNRRRSVTGRVLDGDCPGASGRTAARGVRFEGSCPKVPCSDAEYTTLNRRVRLVVDVMANGTVDFFNDTGGYGFIETEDADDDVFFHMEDVGGEDLTEGTELEFDIEQAPKGPRATNVVRV